MKLLLVEWLSGNNRLCKISASQRVFKSDEEFWWVSEKGFWFRWSIKLESNPIPILLALLQCGMPSWNSEKRHVWPLHARFCSFSHSLQSWIGRLLKSFVTLFPSFHGEDSQNIMIHNLIHLADNVEYTGVELPAISAFVFENSLRWIKEIIRGNSKLLQQLVRRVAENHSCPVAPDLLEVKHPLSKRIHKKEDLIVELRKGASRDTLWKKIARDCSIAHFEGKELNDDIWKKKPKNFLCPVHNLKSSEKHHFSST